MKLEYIPALAAAFAASVWATGKCIDGMTWVMVHLGRDIGHAQAEAPLYTGVLLGAIGCAAIWGWVCAEEERRAQRRKRIDRRHARTEEPEYRQKERDA